MTKHLKETGGYYRTLDHSIEWRCNEITCGSEIVTPVKFGNGTHILTCTVCGAKRKVTVIGRLNANQELIKY